MAVDGIRGALSQTAAPRRRPRIVRESVIRTTCHSPAPDHSPGILTPDRHLEFQHRGRHLSDHDAYVVDVVLPSAPHSWSVYVLEVVGLGPKDVYVGQTWHDPEERRRQHATGIRVAKVFKRAGVSVGRLRPDLLPALPSLTTKELALAAEGQVAQALTAQGYAVYGGH